MRLRRGFHCGGRLWPAAGRHALPALLCLALAPAGRGAGHPGQARRALRSVHVIVILADNRHQGIAPVPARLGNGKDAANNLYWGARYGVKSFFLRSPHWVRVQASARMRLSAAVLERVVFQLKGTRTYLVADAFEGACMRQALVAFLHPGATSLRLEASTTLPLGAGASLRVFVGHNGLMDTRLPGQAPGRETPTKPCMVLACFSASYFKPHLDAGRLWGLLLTTGRMAPEAYTLDAAVRAWARGAPPAAIRSAAAGAYARYQRIDTRSAARLFTGEDGAGASGPATVAAGRRIAGIPCPPAYSRIPLEAGSFAAYVRDLPLKPAGTPVRSWDGRVMHAGSMVLGVIDWPAPSRVQQCADVAIRLHAEYLQAHGDYPHIRYRSLSGDWIEYGKWLRGRYHLNPAGTRILYTPAAAARRHARSVFERYLHFVMLYANSASLARDLARVDPRQLLPGDLYIQPDRSGRGGIGHVSVVVDICRNRAGARRFLCGYGFIPAQDFHLPLPAPSTLDAGWFSLPTFKQHVAAFGPGAFHRFPATGRP